MGGDEIMKFYKDESGTVYAYEDDGSQDSLIGNKTLMTKEEIDSHLAKFEPTIDDMFENVRLAIQHAIDIKAQEFGFSNGNSLILYAGFTNSFQTLAQSFAAWEVSVWVEAGEYKDKVISGTKPMVTPEQAVSMMPKYM